MAVIDGMVMVLVFVLVMFMQFEEQTDEIR